jgi:hypothetical protein
LSIITNHEKIASKFVDGLSINYSNLKSKRPSNVEISLTKILQNIGYHCFLNDKVHHPPAFGTSATEKPTIQHQFYLLP